MGRKESQRTVKLKISKNILRIIYPILAVSLCLQGCARMPTQDVVVDIPVFTKDTSVLRPMPDLPIKHLKETDAAPVVMEAYVQTVLLQNSYINYLKKLRSTQ
jgi:hypothetical protein